MSSNFIKQTVIYQFNKFMDLVISCIYLLIIVTLFITFFGPTYRNLIDRNIVSSDYLNLVIAETKPVHLPKEQLLALHPRTLEKHFSASQDWAFKTMDESDIQYSNMVEDVKFSKIERLMDLNISLRKKAAAVLTPPSITEQASKPQIDCKGSPNLKECQRSKQAVIPAIQSTVSKAVLLDHEGQ